MLNNNRCVCPPSKKTSKDLKNYHKSAAELGPPTPGWRPLARPRSLFISRRQQIAPPLLTRWLPVFAPHRRLEWLPERIGDLRELE